SSKNRPTETEGQGLQQSGEVENQAISDSSEKNRNKDGDCSDDAAENDADSGNGDTQDEGCDSAGKTDESSVAKSQDGGGKKEKVAAKTKTKGHFCPICVGRRFRGPNKLARHMRTHTKEKPFTCPVCSLTFSQSYHMTRHLRTQHDLGKYICTKCGKCSSSWLELKTHKKSHASEGLKCLACDKQFKEKAALVSHLKLHKKVQSSPRSLVCGDCGKVFGRLYHLKRHIMTHRKEANSECFTCPDCQKNFAFPEDLNKHMEMHVKESNGTCPKCNETFNSPEDLETHMEVHEKSYACSTCERKFKLSHYKRHILVHNRRESRCPHCDGVFLQLTALKYHLRTHTEERPHQCSCYNMLRSLIWVNLSCHEHQVVVTDGVL
uniref:C2H2-type domain-containing protein n=1 Tax=Scophthalmus maximus TaxID=52904 RepID=A0A8D3DYA8_SCOMX